MLRSTNLCFTDWAPRGYVKKELIKNNIPFFHSYVKNLDELVPLYQALDIYLITSREEGGPLGLIESMSCGIPVVTTQVGMSTDVINKNVPGEISNTFDPKILAYKIELTLDSVSKNKIESVNVIRKNIIKFDWKEVANNIGKKFIKI